jgi:hypothetical protein
VDERGVTSATKSLYASWKDTKRCTAKHDFQGQFRQPKILLLTQTTEKIVTTNRTFNSMGKTLDTIVFPVCLKYRSVFETNEQNVLTIFSIVWSTKDIFRWPKRFHFSV